MAGEVMGGDRTTVIATPDGRALSFCVWGDPAGAPVFLMHGTPGSRMLRDPSDAHRRDGVAVCVYDRPGYGRSQRRRARSHAQTADDVGAIAAALGWERFAVAGVSAGSGPCLAVAALLPDRVTRCAVIVGAGPLTDPEMQAGMSPDDHADWAPALRGDEDVLAREFDGFLQWFDAGMPGSGVDDEASRRMLAEVVEEARRQGPAGYIDDNIASGADWGFVVEDVHAPTIVVAARQDSHFMHHSARWLGARIPGAELRWRDGGHLNPNADSDPGLFHWLGHGAHPGNG